MSKAERSLACDGDVGGIRFDDVSFLWKEDETTAQLPMVGAGEVRPPAPWCRHVVNESWGEEEGSKLNNTLLLDEEEIQIKSTEPLRQRGRIRSLGRRGPRRNEGKSSRSPTCCSKPKRPLSAYNIFSNENVENSSSYNKNKSNKQSRTEDSNVKNNKSNNNKHYAPTS